MSSRMEVSNHGSDYELFVTKCTDGAIEIRVDLVLSEYGRERQHFPRLTPSEARELADALVAAADWLDTH